MGEEHFRENKISQVILIFETKIVHSYNFIYLFIYLFFLKVFLFWKLLLSTQQTCTNLPYLFLPL